MMIYFEANRAGEHVRELGIPNFRVATVTTTADRVAQMIDAKMELANGRGSNVFLFTTNPLDAVWLTGKGERIRLTT